MSSLCCLLCKLVLTKIFASFFFLSENATPITFFQLVKTCQFRVAKFF